MNLENRVQKLEEIVKKLSDKEEYTMSEAEWRERFDKLDRDFPVISLQKDTWETVEEPKQEEKKGVEIVVCPAHGNIEYNVKPPHYCKNKIGEGCNCVCTCKPKQEECKHEISGICIKCGKDALGSKQSVNLRDELENILYHGKLSGELILTQTDQILSLIQSHLLKEIPEEKDYNSVCSELDGCDCSAGGYNQCREDIIKIINKINK